MRSVGRGDSHSRQGSPLSGRWSRSKDDEYEDDIYEGDAYGRKFRYSKQYTHNDQDDEEGYDGLHDQHQDEQDNGQYNPGEPDDGQNPDYDNPKVVRSYISQ